MNRPRQKIPHQQNLRLRYFELASLVALVLVAGAILANNYVNQVTARNAHSLQLRDELNTLIGEFRDELRRADVAQDAMLNAPRAGHQRELAGHLQKTAATLDAMAANTALGPTGLSPAVGKLRDELEKMRLYTGQLGERITDPNWVYPMLPFIRTTMLASHTEFETSARIALNEITANDEQDYAPRVHHAVEEIRDIWRRTILNFRTVVIGFAGLNLSNISEERNIEILHQLLLEKLGALARLNQREPLGLETEEAIRNMHVQATRWMDGFREVQKLRASGIWRADVHFVDNNLRPTQENIALHLGELEKGVSRWSADNIAAVEHAANRIKLELWGLSGIAIGFVVLVYVLLHRSVLSPIARVAASISAEGRHVENLSVPARASREIHSLIAAFNAMRRQINDRQIALEHQALHDTLTGLPNRALLQDRLEQAIHAAHRNDKPVSLMLLDLDRFKEINDTLGHQVGDQVLRQIGRRLHDCMRDSDTVARLGGDEFAILSVDCDQQGALVFVQRVMDALQREVNIEQRRLFVGASIGIALYPGHGEDADTLTRHADIAMYSAKRGNRDYAIFDPDLEQQGVADLSLLNDLRAELNTPSQQFELHYQPQISLHDGEVAGMEALIRWRHPEQDLIPPEIFVRLAEQTGLVSELSRWVLRTAVRECMQWKAEGFDIGVSINLSAMDLQDPDLPGMIERLLRESAMDAADLTLEITESAVMSDPVHAREVLTQLDAMGIALMIDDYGTGFSSLAYLKLLPVRGLKIDKSFVMDMLENDNDAIIVRSTIDLAHNLGIKVLAEGVESAEVLLQLRKADCDDVQGYHISRPAAWNKIKPWLESYSKETLGLNAELIDINRIRGA